MDGWTDQILNTEMVENDGSESSESRCKICFYTEESPENPLLSPCECSGSVGWVHLDCLAQWKLKGKPKVTKTCTVCKTMYSAKVMVAVNERAQELEKKESEEEEQDLQRHDSDVDSSDGEDNDTVVGEIICSVYPFVYAVVGVYVLTLSVIFTLMLVKVVRIEIAYVTGTVIMIAGVIGALYRLNYGYTGHPYLWGMIDLLSMFVFSGCYECLVRKPIDEGEEEEYANNI